MSLCLTLKRFLSSENLARFTKVVFVRLLARHYRDYGSTRYCGVTPFHNDSALFEKSLMYRYTRHNMKAKPRLALGPRVNTDIKESLPLLLELGLVWLSRGRQSLSVSSEANPLSESAPQSLACFSLCMEIPPK